MLNKVTSAPNHHLEMTSDSLRGYAIFAVIAYHVFQNLPNLNPHWTRFLDFGSMGVQLFFMVSAFTIFMT